MANLPVPAKKKKKAGRPSSFNWQTANELLALVQEDRSLKSIADIPGMPSQETLFRWLRNENDDPDLSVFRQKYFDARSSSADSVYAKMQLLEDMLWVGRIDWKSAQVLFTSMQWRAARMQPKVYGEQIRHVGADGGPIKVAHSLEEAILKAQKHTERLAEGRDEVIDVEIEAESEKAQKP